MQLFRADTNRARRCRRDRQKASQAPRPGHLRGGVIEPEGDLQFSNPVRKRDQIGHLKNKAEVLVAHDRASCRLDDASRAKASGPAGSSGCQGSQAVR